MFSYSSYMQHSVPLQLHSGESVYSSSSQHSMPEHWHSGSLLYSSYMQHSVPLQLHKWEFLFSSSRHLQKRVSLYSASQTGWASGTVIAETRRALRIRNPNTNNTTGVECAMFFAAFWQYIMYMVPVVPDFRGRFSRPAAFPNVFLRQYE